MPAIELVMCAACGRPQAQAEKCVQCGQPLPPPIVGSAAEAKDARDQVFDNHLPFLEATLGAGRTLKLSRRRLEWIAGKGARPVQLEVGELATATLKARPIYEALLFAALFGAGAALSQTPWLRIVLGVLAALSVVACFAQRRYALVLERRGGGSAGLFFGIGKRGSPTVQRIDSVWSSVAPELRALGVEVRR